MFCKNCGQEIDDKAEQLSRLEFILTGKEEESFMNYTVILKELPECIVYTKQLNVPSYDAYFELIPAIGAQMQQQYPDLKCRVPEYCFMQKQPESEHLSLLDALSCIGYL